MSEKTDSPSIKDRVSNAAFVLVMTFAKLLPYPRRIAAVGWLFAHVLGPMAGWRKRIRTNLKHARPDLSPTEIERLTRAVPDNAGRSLAETYSGAEFVDYMCATGSLTGPGVQVLEEAAESGTPVILAAAHFGNYDAMRAILTAKGWPVGGLYRLMNNPEFNKHYVPAIETISEPLFPRQRSGLASMLRFLKGGGFLALGFDQYERGGVHLRFFGLPARTVLTPAELALRHNAPLVPIMAIRQPDGLSFQVRVGEPIPVGDAVSMMQALNDDLENMVRAHMHQWLWVHRRWKDQF